MAKNRFLMALALVPRAQYYTKTKNLPCCRNARGTKKERPLSRASNFGYVAADKGGFLKTFR
jgi:hypothetical protein